MLRRAETGDREAILAVVLATGLLEADETDLLGAMFDSESTGPTGSHAIWAVEVNAGTVIAVAYAVQEPMTDGAWNLRLIAVDPRGQRSGVGTSLLTFVERTIRDSDGRLLVVDTSGHDAFAGIRDFYRKSGYCEEARIHDFWQEGDDKVTFTKRLGA